MPETSVLPEGWYKEFFEVADLEQSFRRLRGLRHFYAAAMRGRIRSLQLRVPEAWDHFDRASRLVLKVPVTIPNLVRQFMLNLYLFDNALLDGPVDRSPPIPHAKIPTLPPQVAAEYPEVAQVIELRRAAEGFLRLHMGEDAVARKIFRRLIADRGSNADAALAVHYCGLAAAEQNLGHAAQARLHLENAGFAVQSGGSKLNRARAASILFAFYSWLEMEEDAEGWRIYLENLKCPEPTRDVFIRRAHLLVERCTEQQSLVLI
jgi:hypothetical protein